jgi:protein tyrosine phosphatase
VPYDENRTLREIPGFYISASDVFSPEQLYIVTQAPLEGTVFDLWRTIVETNTEVVVALAMPLEDSLYARYFERERFPMEINGWKIEFLEEKITETSGIDQKQRLVERTFSAVNGTKRRLITHIHYENWPDFGAPAPDLFKKLLIRTGRCMSGSILVHCAAGQGRSGTFVTTDSILKDICRRGVRTINIPKRIIELRMQRKGLVSTVVQLEAVFQAVFTFQSNDV